MARHEEEFTNRANVPDALDEAMEVAIRAEQRRERLMLGTWVGSILVALVVTASVIQGCGGSGDSTTRSTSHVEESNQAPVAVTASTDGAGQGVAQEQGLPTVQAGVPEAGLSAPPDIVAAVSDSFVTAGQAVEVTVQATSDVTELALSDGMGDSIPMVRDSSGLTWRVNYRVPLRPRSDRLGLSITAQNEEHRWRRVWLFLEVGDGNPRVESGAEDPESSYGMK